MNASMNLRKEMLMRKKSVQKPRGLVLEEQIQGISSANHRWRQAWQWGIRSYREVDSETEEIVKARLVRDKDDTLYKDIKRKDLKTGKERSEKRNWQRMEEVKHASEREIQRPH